MASRWTRRQFLASAVLAGAGACAWRARSRAGGDPTLRLALDELIPAGDGMPAASEVGCPAYLERLARDEREVRVELESALAALERVARPRFGVRFRDLDHRQRVEALTEMEKRAAPEEFERLKGYAVEAYYTRPRVWTLLGYDERARSSSGVWGDPALLAPVQRMPRLYRIPG